MTAQIRKIARIHDKATDIYLEVIEFPISDIQCGRLELLPSGERHDGSCEKAA